MLVANDARIAAVASLPKFITQDGDSWDLWRRIRGLSRACRVEAAVAARILFHEITPGGDLCAEQSKKVRRHSPTITCSGRACA